MAEPAHRALLAVRRNDERAEPLLVQPLLDGACDVRLPRPLRHTGVHGRRHVSLGIGDQKERQQIGPVVDDVARRNHVVHARTDGDEVQHRSLEFQCAPERDIVGVQRIVSAIPVRQPFVLRAVAVVIRAVERCLDAQLGLRRNVQFGPQSARNLFV